MEHNSNNSRSHSDTRNVGENDKGGAKFDLASEVKRLQAIYKGLSREKNQILLYLAEVYRSAARLRGQTLDDTRQQIRREFGLTLDARTSRNPYRLLIELTCTCNVKLKSRYANALKFARRKGCTSSQLIALIQKNGGIEKCERAYLLVKCRRKRINLPARLKRTSR